MAIPSRPKQAGPRSRFAVTEWRRKPSMDRQWIGNGSANELEKLTTDAAQYVYARSEPVLWAYCLLNRGRMEEAILFSRAAATGADKSDLPTSYADESRPRQVISASAPAREKIECADTPGTHHHRMRDAHCMRTTAPLGRGPEAALERGIRSSTSASFSCAVRRTRATSRSFESASSSFTSFSEKPRAWARRIKRSLATSSSL